MLSHLADEDAIAYRAFPPPSDTASALGRATAAANVAGLAALQRGPV
jgi:hypothetical protein